MKAHWLTLHEAAQHLRMNSATFKNYVSAGHFPFHVHPETGTKRYLASDLDAQMQKKFAKPVKKAGSPPAQNTTGH